MPEVAFPYRRVLLYGVTGAGKSTLAAKLSELTGLPWHDVDSLTYEADWKQVPDEEQSRRFTEICEGEAWILDTAYGKWRHIPLARVDLIVGLDYSRWLSLGRLLRRTFARIADRQPVCNGNIETWKSSFAKDGILVWHFKSFARKRAVMRALAAESDGPKVLLFEHPRELQAWLEGL